MINRIVWVREQAQLASWLTRFPALTVIVLLRGDVGYRLLEPKHLFATNGLLAFVAYLFHETYPEGHLEWLFLFAIFSCLSGLTQRTKRWTEYKKGLFSHSFYIGTSGFEVLPLPKCFKRERRLGRIADPLCCAATGYALLPTCHALALWLLFSAMCLSVYEAAVYQKELNKKLDVLDGLRESNIHTRDVETFEQAPPPQKPTKSHSQVGIPTGIGPDIATQIKRRKK